MNPLVVETIILIIGNVGGFYLGRMSMENRLAQAKAEGRREGMTAEVLQMLKKPETRP